MYRIKTESELISEFGVNWAQTARYGWAFCMNRFFGMVFETMHPAVEIGTFKPSENGYVFNKNHALQLKADEVNKAKENYATFLKNFDPFRITNKESYKTVQYLTSDNNQISFNITLSPTGNCQLASIAHLDRVLVSFKDISLIRNFLKDIFNKNVTNGKKLLYFDVNQSYGKVIEQLNPICSSPYISSNESKMLQGILRINNY